MLRISSRVIWQVLADILLTNVAAVLALALRYMPAPIPTGDWHFYTQTAGLLTLLPPPHLLAVEALQAFLAICRRARPACGRPGGHCSAACSSSRR